MKIKLKSCVFVTAVVLLSARAAYADQALLHKQTGDGFLRRGQITSAIHEYQEAVRLSPNLSAAYFNMAIAYYSKMDLEKTVQALEKVIRLDPNDAEAIYNLACIKFYQHDLKEAKVRFQKTCSCSGCRSVFSLKSKGALKLIGRIEMMDHWTQNAFFALLQKNLPVLALS